MLFMNYKLKEESVLKMTQTGQDKPSLPSGLTVKYIGKDDEENDSHRA